jgi:hypothetical protein
VTVISTAISACVAGSKVNVPVNVSVPRASKVAEAPDQRVSDWGRDGGGRRGQICQARRHLCREEAEFAGAKSDTNARMTASSDHWSHPFCSFAIDSSRHAFRAKRSNFRGRIAELCAEVISMLAERVGHPRFPELCASSSANWLWDRVLVGSGK